MMFFDFCVYARSDGNDFVGSFTKHAKASRLQKNVRHNFRGVVCDSGNVENMSYYIIDFDL